MQISRDKFILLVAAIAQANCSSEPPAQQPQPLPPMELPVQPVLEVAPPPTADPTAEVTPTTTPEPGITADPVTPVAGTCNNDVGSPSCASVKIGRGPSCEGFADECADTVKGGMGFRPRVAEAITTCWSKRGQAACSAGPKIACIKEAVKQACPDPAVVPKCQSILASCTAAHKKTKFTLDQCVQILSSVTGRDRTDAESAMAPMAEGCTLSFVLPYYPFQLGWK